MSFDRRGSSGDIPSSPRSPEGSVEISQQNVVADRHERLHSPGGSSPRSAGEGGLIWSVGVGVGGGSRTSSAGSSVPLSPRSRGKVSSVIVDAIRVFDHGVDLQGGNAAGSGGGGKGGDGAGSLTPRSPSASVSASSDRVKVPGGQAMAAREALGLPPFANKTPPSSTTASLSSPRGSLSRRTSAEGGVAGQGGGDLAAQDGSPVPVLSRMALFSGGGAPPSVSSSTPAAAQPGAVPASSAAAAAGITPKKGEPGYIGKPPLSPRVHMPAAEREGQRELGGLSLSGAGATAATTTTQDNQRGKESLAPPSGGDAGEGPGGGLDLDPSVKGGKPRRLVLACRLWLVDCGLGVVGCGLWVVVCGLWFDFEILGLRSGAGGLGFRYAFRGLDFRVAEAWFHQGEEGGSMCQFFGGKRAV